MLVLTRKIGEEIIIDEKIRIVVIGFRGLEAIRLGISAPDDIVIDRLEIHRLKKLEEEARRIKG